MILDVLMPGRDGLDVCRTMRAAGDWTPVLMLTARDDVEDRIGGLDAGADDYLPKPFALASCRLACGRCCDASAPSRGARCCGSRISSSTPARSRRAAATACSS